MKNNELEIAKVLESDVDNKAINVNALTNKELSLADKLAELSKHDELYAIKIATPIGDMTISHYGKAPNLADIKRYLKLNYPQYVSSKVTVKSFNGDGFSYTPTDQFPNPITKFGSIYEVEFTYTKLLFFRKRKTIRYIESSVERPVSLYNLLSPYRKALITSVNIIGKVLPASPNSLAHINGSLINVKPNKRKY